MNIGKNRNVDNITSLIPLGGIFLLLDFGFWWAVFNKKIKTRFPILFERALDFHLMKAKGEFNVVISLSSMFFRKGETRRNIIMNNSTPSDLKKFIHIIFPIIVNG